MNLFKLLSITGMQSGVDVQWTPPDQSQDDSTDGRRGFCPVLHPQAALGTPLAVPIVNVPIGGALDIPATLGRPLAPLVPLGFADVGSTFLAIGQDISLPLHVLWPVAKEPPETGPDTGPSSRSRDGGESEGPPRPQQPPPSSPARLDPLLRVSVELYSLRKEHDRLAKLVDSYVAKLMDDRRQECHRVLLWTWVSRLNSAKQDLVEYEEETRRVERRLTALAGRWQAMLRCLYDDWKVEMASLRAYIVRRRRRR